MTTEQIIGFSLALIIMLIGFIGCILPGLPGTPLVLIAAIVHRIYFGINSVNNMVLAILIALTLISLALDYVASAYGAKRFGATWRGAVGAAVGGIVGLFFGLPGIVAGPFVGATALEMFGGYEFKKAAHVGIGAVLGLVAGAIGKTALCVVMIGL